MKNNFSEHLTYLPFAKTVIQKRLSYKLSFFMRIFGGALQVLIMYYLWMAIYDNSATGNLYGFTRVDMITYVIISYITSKSILANIEGTMAAEIRSGEIAMNLIKPISYYKRLLYQCLGENILQVITVSIPLWIGVTSIKTFIFGEALPSISTILLFILSLCLGFITMFLFNFIFGLSAFYVTYIWGFMVLKSTILRFISGELIPIAFFPAIIVDILKFLPFSSMNYTPVMIYMEKFAGQDLVFALAVQVVWIIILYILVKILWGKAVKKLTILGG